MAIPEGRNNALFNRDIMRTLENEGVDPIRILAQIAAGTLVMPDGTEHVYELNDRLAAAKELAQYVYPKKRSLDVNKEIKASVQLQVVKFADVMPDQAAIVAEEVQKLQENKSLLIGNMSKDVKKMLMQDVRHLDAVTVEAMREDVEALVVDENGIVQNEY